MKSCVFKVFLKKGTVFKEKGWKMVENSVISIFEGVYSLILMKKVRKTHKNEQQFEKIFFQSRVENLIFHPRLFRIFLNL